MLIGEEDEVWRSDAKNSCGRKRKTQKDRLVVSAAMQTLLRSDEEVRDERAWGAKFYVKAYGLVDSSLSSSA